MIYAQLEDTKVLEPRDSDWEPARMFFEERKLKRADLGGAGDWVGWSEELDGVCLSSFPLFSFLICLSFQGICRADRF